MAEDRVLKREKVVWSLQRMMHAQQAMCWSHWREVTNESQQEQLVGSATIDYLITCRCNHYLVVRPWSHLITI